MLITINLT